MWGCADWRRLRGATAARKPWDLFQQSGPWILDLPGFSIRHGRSFSCCLCRLFFLFGKSFHMLSLHRHMPSESDSRYRGMSFVCLSNGTCRSLMVPENGFDMSCHRGTTDQWSIVSATQGEGKFCGIFLIRSIFLVSVVLCRPPRMMEWFHSR